MLFGGIFIVFLTLLIFERKNKKIIYNIFFKNCFLYYVLSMVKPTPKTLKTMYLFTFYPHIQILSLNYHSFSILEISFLTPFR